MMAVVLPRSCVYNYVVISGLHFGRNIPRLKKGVTPITKKKKKMQTNQMTKCIYPAVKLPCYHFHHIIKIQIWNAIYHSFQFQLLLSLFISFITQAHTHSFHSTHLKIHLYLHLKVLPQGEGWELAPRMHSY